MRSLPYIALIHHPLRHAEHALRFADGLFDVAEIERGLLHLCGETAPMAGVDAQFDVAMETGMGPLVRAGDMAVLDRVPMDVIEMTLEIVFVLQGVLPIAGLPYPATPLPLAAFGDHVVLAANLQPTLRELFLEPTPSLGILAVAGRQCPNRMEVLGQ